MLKEARIILPVVSLDHEHAIVHRGLRRLLNFWFDGCIVTQGSGYWGPFGPTLVHTVSIYDVAMEDTSVNVTKLVELAHNAAGALNQETVYIRLPNGRVNIDKIGQPSLDLSQLDPHGDHFPPARGEPAYGEEPRFR